MKSLGSFFRITYKIIAFLILLFFFFLSSFGIFLFYRRNPERRRYKYSKNATFYCARMVQVMGVRVHRRGILPDTHFPFLYVSNHLGFLDVLVSNSQFPMFFVTSLEMKRTPLLGQLTDFGGCLYVDRQSRANIENELAELVEYLRKGYQVVLYPEATSGNGEYVLPFKRFLLSAAAVAEVPIQPVVFNVRSVNGEPFTMKWRDYVCWYGDLSFAGSMFRLFSLKSVDVELNFLPQTHPSAWDDRRSVADGLHALISSHFVPVKDYASVVQRGL